MPVTPSATPTAGHHRVPVENAALPDAWDAGLVSIIVPTHNRADLIGETLQSAHAQSYDAIEIIVVDDGSTDDTEAAVARVFDAADRTRHTYVRTEQAGAPTARNEGLQRARGEFIQFLDSDDLLHPEKLTRQVAYLRAHPEADAVYCYSTSFNESRTARPARLYHDPSDKLDFALRPWSILFHTEAALWRRSAVKHIGGWDESLPRLQDWDYLVRHLIRGGTLHCQREVLSEYRVHTGQLTVQKRTPASPTSTPQTSATGIRPSVYLYDKIYSLLASYGRHDWVPALAERVWWRWLNLLINRQIDDEGLRRLLQRMETAGHLSAMPRWCTALIDRWPSTAPRVRAVYDLWFKLQRLRAMRPART